MSTNSCTRVLAGTGRLSSILPVTSLIDGGRESQPASDPLDRYGGWLSPPAFVEGSLCRLELAGCRQGISRGAPTIYRMLVQQDLKRYQWKLLSHCVGAGEPLNPEVIESWKDATGITSGVIGSLSGVRYCPIGMDGSL